MEPIHQQPEQAPATPSLSLVPITVRVREIPKKVSLKALLFFVVLFSLILASGWKTYEENKSKIIQQTRSTIVHPNAFGDIELEGEAAYVYDAKTSQVLFEKNSRETLPLASLTKIMTAITAASLMPLDTPVTISGEDLSQEGDSSLYAFEKWNLLDLLRFTLIVSSNDGASAVAAIGNAHASSTDGFIGAMNHSAQKLNLTSLSFANESGLDLSQRESGAYGSAHDVALLFAYGIKAYPQIFEPTGASQRTMVSESNLTHTAENTDEIIGDIPGIIASKTGYTDLAGGNLAVAFDADLGHPIILVVLGSSKEGRFTDMQKLVAAATRAVKINE